MLYGPFSKPFHRFNKSFPLFSNSFPRFSMYPVSKRNPYCHLRDFLKLWSHSISIPGTSSLKKLGSAPLSNLVTSYSDHRFWMCRIPTPRTSYSNFREHPHENWSIRCDVRELREWRIRFRGYVMFSDLRCITNRGLGSDILPNALLQ